MADKKGRKVKCKNCGNMVYKSECYIYEYLDRNFNVKIKYYCNEDCSNEKENEQELIEEVYELLNEILEIPVRTNMFFNNLFKDIRNYYEMKVIKEFLESEREYLEVSLYKDFYTNNAKIKYFFAIMQDKIDRYKDIVKNRERNEIMKEREVEIIDEDDFIPKVKIEEIKERSIEDIINSL